MCLNVDHHGDNLLYGKINVVDARPAASAQIVVTTYDGLRVSFYKKEAETIYFGV
ncbi:MAG: hypothetical protein JOZ19_16665 [Rubrobacter sp.]|nr:hypothetical protein [Rubrobacter sp.]